MEQQFITAARGASCFMHAASFRAFINEPGLTRLLETILQAALAMATAPPLVFV